MFLDNVDPQNTESTYKKLDGVNKTENAKMRIV